MTICKNPMPWQLDGHPMGLCLRELNHKGNCASLVHYTWMRPGKIITDGAVVGRIIYRRKGGLQWLEGRFRTTPPPGAIKGP